MELSQHKYSLIGFSGGLIIAIIAYSLGLPVRYIVSLVILQLVSLLLNILWGKNSSSYDRMIGPNLIGALIFLWLGGYFFHIPLYFIVLGTVFMTAGMALTDFWVERDIARARQTIAQWATRNGGELLEFEQRMSTGPFGGWHGRGEMYFQFVVSDRQRQRHQGWAYFDCRLFSNGHYQIKWVENA